MKTIKILCLLTVFTLTAQAENLPTSINYNNQAYEQCQDFTLRYGLIIKVADIAWYAPNCDSQVSILKAPNKVVRFYYHKNVSADFFQSSAAEYFLLNLNNSVQQSKLAQPLQKFNAAYTDIKAGEYFDLVHQQDQELSLFKNQQLLTVENHPEFARNYFNIWFGSVPVIKKLKDAFVP